MKCFKCGKDTKSWPCSCGFDISEQPFFVLTKLSDEDKEAIIKACRLDKPPKDGLSVKLGEYVSDNVSDQELDKFDKSKNPFYHIWWLLVHKPILFLPIVIVVALAVIFAVVLSNKTTNIGDQAENTDPFSITENLVVASVDTNDEEKSIGWGDSSNGRPSYTGAEINAGLLGNTITFNSISNGEIGDEKNFVGVKSASSSEDTWNNNSIKVEDGGVYRIRLYVHNNNPNGENAVAKDVRATVSLPTTVSTSHTIIGYLDSSNAEPSRYWDDVTLYSDELFYIEYVAGSAEYTNDKMGTLPISDSVITSGAPLGYSRFDGAIPGGTEYDGVVTIDVRVHASRTFSRIAVTARLKGTKDWTEAVWANVGDEVEYQIEYKNLLNERVDDVMIRAILPTNAVYIDGSTVLFNSNHQDGVTINEDTVTTSGINIGSYNPRGNAYVQFTVRIVDNTLAEGITQLVNWANATVNEMVVKDDASVFVRKSKP